MPLQTKKAGDCRGSEANGSRSDKWCSLCYQHGKFMQPDCTLEEMLDIVDRALRREKANFIMRRLALRQVPTLERWR